MSNPYMPTYNPYSYPYSNTNNSLIRVTGIDGAKAYQMPANSVVPLFDANEDIMYIKSTDGAGFPTIRAFSFKEISQEAKKDSGYVSREEFEAFREEMLEYGKQFIQPTTKTARTEKS